MDVLLPHPASSCRLEADREISHLGDLSKISWIVNAVHSCQESRLFNFFPAATMYRAIVSPLRIRDVSYRALRRDLINQFRHSPLCAEVLVAKDEVDVCDDMDTLLGEKVKYLTNYNELKGAQLTSVIVGLGGSLSQEMDGVPVSSYSYVSTIFQKFPSVKEKELFESLRRGSPDVRISAYRVGMVLPSAVKGEKSPFVASRMETVKEATYPILSQFLPADYREIESKHLALAMRLNYETCEPDYKSGKVEMLSFVDCMKIIGLEDKI